MTNNATIHHRFSLLEGTWRGEGQGDYPVINSFDYRETLTFTRRDERSLAYEQRTESRFDGHPEWRLSHWENGFIQILESGEVEMVNAQSGGRCEVLVGVIEIQGGSTRIRFESKEIVNDPRMVSSARTFEVEGDSLRYEMEMQTTAVGRSLTHLKAELRRTK
jgi:THAP domain-containing protein 4